MWFRYVGWLRVVIIVGAIMLVRALAMLITDIVYTYNIAEFLTLLCVGLWLLLMVVVIVLIYPFKADVQGDTLIVRKIYKPLKISLHDIAKCRRIDGDYLDGSVQKWWAAGARDYWGVYRHPILGAYTMYTFDLKNLYLFELKNGRKYVISLAPKTENERDFVKRLTEITNEVE